jgi:nitrogen fixation protein NifQ
LIAAAINPERLDTLAFAGVIAANRGRSPPYDQPIAGLRRGEMVSLVSAHFPRLAESAVAEIVMATTRELDVERVDEFEDLVELLLEHASFPGDNARWLACAVATASMAENHLWQDMGLPSRRELNQLLECDFTRLFIRNVDDMKWKKFFYRQLCERAEVLICKSPSCGVCIDYGKCFGPEDAAPVGLHARAPGAWAGR